MLPDTLSTIDRVTAACQSRAKYSRKSGPKFSKKSTKMVSSKSSDMLLTHVALPTQIFLSKSAGIVFKYEYDGDTLLH